MRREGTGAARVSAEALATYRGGGAFRSDNTYPVIPLMETTLVRPLLRYRPYASLIGRFSAVRLPLRLRPALLGLILLGGFLLAGAGWASPLPGAQVPPPLAVWTDGVLWDEPTHLRRRGLPPAATAPAAGTASPRPSGCVPGWPMPAADRARTVAAYRFCKTHD